MTENVHQMYRRTTMPKCDFNSYKATILKIALRYRYSPVNLLHIFKLTQNFKKKNKVVTGKSPFFLKGPLGHFGPLTIVSVSILASCMADFWSPNYFILVDYEDSLSGTPPTFVEEREPNLWSNCHFSRKRNAHI